MFESMSFTLKYCSKKKKDEAKLFSLGDRFMRVSSLCLKFLNK